MPKEDETLNRGTPKNHATKLQCRARDVMVMLVLRGCELQVCRIEMSKVATEKYLTLHPASPTFQPPRIHTKSEL